MVEGEPSHVIITKEVNVVKSTHADLVLGTFVDVDIFADARITSSPSAHTTDGRKRLVIILGSLTALCVVKDYHRQPDPTQLLCRDDILGLFKLYVVEFQPRIEPG